MNTDDSAVGTGLDNKFCIVAAGERMSLDSERKIPIIPMIDVYCKKKLMLSVPYGNSYKMEFAKCNLHDNYGLVIVGNCSLAEVSI